MALLTYLDLLSGYPTGGRTVGANLSRIYTLSPESLKE